MKAVLQRVARAAVSVDEREIARIGRGLVILLGVAKGDTEQDARYMVDKIATLRIFADDAGKMNRSVLDIGGEVLVVSQFTLLGDTGRGRRPGFEKAASPDHARELYEQVAVGLNGLGIEGTTGKFGAHMVVSLENDGPVTFLLESRGTGDRGTNRHAEKSSK